ncbi:MAG: right-handed parallel beta-helix repeat-containing protein, partial [Acidiferrobacterales bacterium]|nr:right-handed parallel beta-helix repeat-containing protein [Acidiferrobacterales bacterium]
CVNSGGPFGEDDSIVFDSGISNISLDLDLAGTNLNIFRDVSINKGGSRVTINGEGMFRSVLFIYYGAQVKLHNLIVTGGVGGGSAEGRAGGITVSDSTVTLVDSLISGNFGDVAIGGISLDNSTAIITNSEVSNNVGHIGGIALSNSSNAIFRNSTISENKGEALGGITIADSSAIFINSTISNNQALDSEAGGILVSAVGVYDGDVTFYNSTVSDNIAPTLLPTTATKGASVGGFNATILFKNTIVANSVGQPGCDTLTTFEGPSNVVFDGPNLVDDGSCGSDILSNVINEDAKLDKLQLNGGVTRSHALFKSSPAIDAGDNTVCGASRVGNIDQRGVSRPFGTACDLGSYEYLENQVPRGLFPIIPFLLDENSCPNGICNPQS